MWYLSGHVTVIVVQRSNVTEAKKSEFFLLWCQNNSEIFRIFVIRHNSNIDIGCCYIAHFYDSVLHADK